jgi:DNA topoisomerase-1
MRRKAKSISVAVNAKKSLLVYVNDNSEGILRKGSGKKFSYFYKGNKITDENILRRIKALVIPPAWKSVWICHDENGHIQATGRDLRNRKQYRYHSEWNSMRNDKKFEKLMEFGRVLPQLRKQIEKDMNIPQLTQEKVISAVIGLMERTYIRIGNSIYEKENGSYGLTTLKDKHVSINGASMKLSFTGKKGIRHSISLHNKKLARIIKQCRDIPGKELFQYYDENGQTHVIDSGKVNSYIRQLTEGDFTAKDFRTWAGSLNILRAFREIGSSEKKSEIKKNIVTAIDYVSKKLGNTRSVCKKYYIHPLLISLYEENCLMPYLEELNKIEKSEKGKLTCEEKVLMNILQSASMKRKRVA